jgi:putative redox protein
MKAANANVLARIIRANLQPYAMAAPTSVIVYKGELSTDAEHLRSATVIRTDAPVDNHGLGRSFSPTDLLATALGSCMLTIMGIEARKMKVNIDHTTATVTKEMASNPRRVTQVNVDLMVESSILSMEQRAALENAALNCPVAKSLSEHLKQVVRFNYRNP